MNNNITMTRSEQRLRASKNWADKAYKNDKRNVYDVARSGFIAGAMWADQHPNLPLVKFNGDFSVLPKDKPFICYLHVDGKICIGISVWDKSRGEFKGATPMLDLGKEYKGNLLYFTPIDTPTILEGGEK